ncbi:MULTISPECIES: non-canonical purine NTP pyrophosphatase [unclassified Acinetobacter]|uniref:non-canonical purine NTP pyrophosphatase n=1 Tax=Acinetobacter TaxID=469 RepID=UPI00158C297B|nr:MULTISPECIES: non-canonical purine NTP pyrophosphatase [unclassified Acinetobacter]QKW82340.1 non-canonical purine NTP pyrophosphatase [Acinetobacter sp. FDAARGOS_724]
MDIYIVSRNPHKQTELRKYLESLAEVSVKEYAKEINEIQTLNVEELIKDKLIKAFQFVKSPVIVEHTGLFLDEFDGFPGGLTQPFWDKLQKEKFCHYFKSTPLKAKTVIGFCDGKQNHYFEGEIEGIVANEPRGDDSFQWDCVFIPKGYDKTFAELGDEKLKISMRKLAFDKFEKYIRDNYV